MGRWAALTLAALLACSCGDARPRADQKIASVAGSATPGEDAMASADPQMQGGLVATFVAPSKPIASTTSGALTFVVENRGASPVTIDTDQLGSAIFALEFHDASGKRIYTIPPGMPPANYKPNTETLQPKATRKFTVGLNVFSPPLPAEKYTARVQIQPIASEPLHFEISPGGP